MKNLFLSVLAVLGFALSVSAQEGATKTKTKKTEKVTSANGKTAVKEKTETKTVLKKDGTPDKRYKVNQEKKVVLKKDGTPDKRYK
jgi:hypothetical protein